MLLLPVSSRRCVGVRKLSGWPACLRVVSADRLSSTLQRWGGIWFESKTGHFNTATAGSTQPDGSCSFLASSKLTGGLPSLALTSL